jgi:hypothetical protein
MKRILCVVAVLAAFALAIPAMANAATAAKRPGVSTAVTSKAASKSTTHTKTMHPATAMSHHGVASHTRKHVAKKG